MIATSDLAIYSVKRKTKTTHKLTGGENVLCLQTEVLRAELTVNNCQKFNLQ